MTATTAKKMFLLIFVFDILAALSRYCWWRGLRNHNFIIIQRPGKKTRGAWIIIKKKDMRLAPCGHQNNRTCISKFTEAHSEPLNASHHCNNIVNTFKLISSYYHLSRSRLAIRNISNLHQQVHRGSRMRAHGRERIASVATALQVVSTLFHFFLHLCRSRPAFI